MASVIKEVLSTTVKYCCINLNLAQASFSEHWIKLKSLLIASQLDYNKCGSTLICFDSFFFSFH